jgi:hypothetical protein|tara:strand:+ start:1783 stop:2238 length:456 start_codon:yes stop_codon:yes gene_type:complete
MYAIEINEQIKLYNELPKSWGNIIGGFNTISDEEAENYGFYTVEIPDYNKQTQNLGDLYFDEDKFTYEIQTMTFSESLSELKSNKIADLRTHTNEKLSMTDWYVIRNAERGVDIPQDIQDERASILNNHDTNESNINSLTTKAGVVGYEFE